MTAKHTPEPGRYELTDLGVSDDGRNRLIHVLDTARVDATHAPQAASRTYEAHALGQFVFVRREGAGETRAVLTTGGRAVQCTCPCRGECVHLAVAEMTRTPVREGRLVVWPRAELRQAA